mmetsp:Transcript_107110/g.345618  ORF Transcript_107110/g.345618 Transcript_107110/m.345618 type:complete len:202 (-) Transcript_107110:2-607(-)
MSPSTRVASQTPAKLGRWGPGVWPAAAEASFAAASVASTPAAFAAAASASATAVSSKAAACSAAGSVRAACLAGIATAGAAPSLGPAAAAAVCAGATSGLGGAAMPAAAPAASPFTASARGPAAGCWPRASSVGRLPPSRRPSWAAEVASKSAPTWAWAHQQHWNQATAICATERYGWGRAEAGAKAAPCRGKAVTRATMA